MSWHVRMCSCVSLGSWQWGHLCKLTASGEIFNFWQPVLSHPWMLLEVFTWQRGLSDKKAAFRPLHCSFPYSMSKETWDICYHPSDQWWGAYRWWWWVWQCLWGTIGRQSIHNDHWWVYKANLHWIVQVSMMDTFGTTNDTPELMVNPKSLHPVAKDYDSMWPCFAWLPTNVIKKTFKVTTQYAQMPYNSILHKWYKSPNSALNIMHHNEPVATNMIKSDMPAIDGGEKCTQIFVGKKMLITDVYPMKTLAQFPGTLMDNITVQGAPTKLVSNHARVEISKCIQDILWTMYIGAWQSEPHYQHQNVAEWQYCTMHYMRMKRRSEKRLDGEIMSFFYMTTGSLPCWC